MRKIVHMIVNKRMIFYFLVILILVVPFIKTYSAKNEYGEGVWENVFVFKELDLILLFLPLIILTFLMYFSKNNIRLIYWFLIICSLFYSGLGMVAILTPSMDSYPLLGTYLMVLLFPSVLFFMKPQRHKEHTTSFVN